MFYTKSLGYNLQLCLPTLMNFSNPLHLQQNIPKTTVLKNSLMFTFLKLRSLLKSTFSFLLGFQGFHKIYLWLPVDSFRFSDETNILLVVKIKWLITLHNYNYSQLQLAMIEWSAISKPYVIDHCFTSRNVVSVMLIYLMSSSEGWLFNELEAMGLC